MLLPAVVHDYNVRMIGVDLNDMRTYMFLDERRTLRWNKKVFFTLLGKLLLNFFIIYQQNTQVSEKLKRQFYCESSWGTYWWLLSKMKETWSKVKVCPKPNASASRKTYETKLPSGKKRNRVVCSDLKKGICRWSSCICIECDVALCIGECWEKYTKKEFHWKCYCNYSI